MWIELEHGFVPLLCLLGVCALNHTRNGFYSQHLFPSGHPSVSEGTVDTYKQSTPNATT